jgi:dissimilatory sulfite reductase related protein
MAQRDISGTLIDFDDDGYMTSSESWSPKIAEALATEEGIQVTDRHFTVLEFMRKDFEEKGAVPSIRRLGKFSGVAIKELYQLFPGGPAKKAARIAGLTKPQGCV